MNSTDAEGSCGEFLHLEAGGINGTREIEEKGGTRQ